MTFQDATKHYDNDTRWYSDTKNHKNQVSRVALDCHHQAIMTPSEIKASLVEERYDPVTDTRQPVIVCPECKEHKPG